MLLHANYTLDPEVSALVRESIPKRRSVGVTGHRPPRLGGYTPEVETALSELAGRVVAEHKSDQWITGMAQGWDLAIAEACAAAGIPFIAAIAHPKQSSRWPAAQQERYQRLLDKALFVETYADDPSKGAYLARDRWIAQNSDLLIALWDGTPTGGTWATIQYAEEVGKGRVINVWDQWLETHKPDTTWANGFN